MGGGGGGSVGTRSVRISTRRWWWWWCWVGLVVGLVVVLMLVLVVLVEPTNKDPNTMPFAREPANVRALTVPKKKRPRARAGELFLYDPTH